MSGAEDIWNKKRARAKMSDKSNDKELQLLKIGSIKRSGETLCFLCGKMGHMMIDCPCKGPWRNVICLLYRQNGHSYHKC